MDVAIVLFEAFDELDGVGPFEVFQNAANAGADVSTTLCTLEPADTVTAVHGLRVEPDVMLDERDPALLLAPGGGWTNPGAPGVRREYDDARIPDAIAITRAAVASVCTGAMLLAAGVLDGRPATTHHDAETDLRDTDADLRDARVVDDDVLTCGVTAGLDLAIRLVEREFGPEIADAVAHEMEYEPTSDVHERES